MFLWCDSNQWIAKERYVDMWYVFAITKKVWYVSKIYPENIGGS